MPDDKLTEAVKFMASEALVDQIREVIDASDYPRMTVSEWVRQACEAKLGRRD